MKITTLSMAVLLVLLTSCSSNKVTTVQQLQKEYNNHQYSRYVIDNIKAQPVRVVKASLTQNEKGLNVIKRQLTSRKKQASSQLNNTVSNNGLFSLSHPVQQQIARLNKNQLEAWLKKNSSLNAVLNIALKNNLDIKSAKEQAQSSLAKYDQVAYLDDMLAQYASFTKDIKLTGSTQKHKKSVSAAFPFPGLSALKSSIIDQAVISSRLALKQTTQDVITEARIAYAEMQYAEKNIALLGKKTNLLRSLKEELKNDYSTNTGELSSILQVDIKIESNRNKQQLSKDKKQAMQARLNALTNLSSDFTLGKLDTLSTPKMNLNAKSLIVKGNVNRIEIARLQSEVEKMKRIIQLSEKRFYPDFDAGFSRFQGGKLSDKAKIKKTSFFAKNDAYLTETKAKYKALQSKVRALQNKTTDNIQQTLSRYQSQKSTYQLYQKKVLPKARTELDISKSLYETGETSLFEVIDTRVRIIDFQLKSIEALKNMQVSSAKLRRLVGLKSI